MPSSTPRLMREIRKLAKDLAPRGTVVDIGLSGGGHIVCEMDYNGRRRKVFTSASPSDRRSHLAITTELKAAARFLEGRA